MGVKTGTADDYYLRNPRNLTFAERSAADRSAAGSAKVAEIDVDPGSASNTILLKQPPTRPRLTGRIFADADSADAWFKVHDREGVAFECPVIEQQAGPASLFAKSFRGRNHFCIATTSS